MDLTKYIESVYLDIPHLKAYKAVWDIVPEIEAIVAKLVDQVDSNEYVVKDNVAIHKTAQVDPTATIKAPVVIGPNSMVGPYAFLRGGVYLGANSIIGYCCEIKSCIILKHSGITHLSYVADSIVGDNVNFEAGVSVINYFSERPVKEIPVKVGEDIIQTNIVKFGALVGDGCKIGGNATLTPGTILSPNTVVARLELVEQIKANS